MRHSGLPLAIAGSHTSTHTLPEHRRAQNADHLAHNTPFSAFFTKVVCDLGATPPQVAASPSPIRGIARHEPPTRRRHAARRCRVVQNPHDRRCGGHRRIRRVAGLAAVPVGGGWAWPGFKATRRAKLAARTARGRAAAHGRTKQPGRNNSARGAAPVTGRCTRYGAVHPIRRGALPTDRVRAQSQEQTRNLRDDRRHAANTPAASSSCCKPPLPSSRPLRRGRILTVLLESAPAGQVAVAGAVERPESDDGNHPCKSRTQFNAVIFRDRPQTA